MVFCKVAGAMKVTEVLLWQEGSQFSHCCRGIEVSCSGIPLARRLTIFTLLQGIEIACRGIPLARRLTIFCNAAGALKLLAEAFPWQEGSQFVYTQDNHNSVLGIRELALDQGATATCVEMSSGKGDLLGSCASLGICLCMLCHTLLCHAVPHLATVCCMLCHTILCHAVHAVPHLATVCCMLCHVMLCHAVHAVPKAIPGERLHQQPALGPLQGLCYCCC